ncbi:MAG: FkbM family methyltransferase [Verrucomicrobiales bacterium]|jgi:FkbM family methyltransferase|nr:FkbM family methyltransferase [Verrucomicrobiales bacterium]
MMKMFEKIKRRDSHRAKTVYRWFGLTVYAREVERAGLALEQATVRTSWTLLGVTGSVFRGRRALQALLIHARDHARKLSLEHNIVHVSDADFYVPNFPCDYVQNVIVNSGDFYERALLDRLRPLIVSGAVILDIGANIGNHTVYFAKVCGAKKIHAFEPVRATFEILRRNIELNNLSVTVSAHNWALGDRNGGGRVAALDAHNIGAQRVAYADSEDAVTMRRLDDADLGEPRVDFVKIDVEGFELEVLAGGRNFFARHRPLVFVESFGNKALAVRNFFTLLGYELQVKFPGGNYLFASKTTGVRR